VSQTFSGNMTIAQDSGAGDRNGAGFFARSMRRHWRGTVAIGVLLSALSITVIILLPPKYSASAFLQVQSRANVIDIPDVLPSVALDVGGISSEVEILRSHDMAQAVAARLNMTELPGHHAGIGALLKRYLPWSEIKATVYRLLNIRANTPEEEVTSYLLRNEAVKPVGKSRVVEIAFTAGTPEEARNVANAFAQAYIDRQAGEIADAGLTAKGWIESEIERVRRQVQQDERSLEDFRARKGLTEDGAKLLLPYGHLADLDHDLTGAMADSSAANARVAEIKRLEHAGTLLNAVPESINSPALRALRQQEAELTIQLDEMLQHYSPDSGRVRVVEAEKAQLQRSIRAELGRIAESLQSEASLAASEVASMRGSVAAAKNGLQLSGGERVELMGLQREAEANRQVLVTLMKRRSELASKTSLHAANARLVSPASLPNEPSFPQLLPMAALALLGSFATAAAVGVGRDFNQKTIRSTDELTALVPYRMLGILPRFQPARHPDRLIALAADRSRFSEAVKNLYVRVAPPGHKPPSTIVVTSALPAEGKTTTAVSLAMLAATLGRKVVLVDFDTRAPSVHHILQLPLGPGLAEYVTGQAASLAECLQQPLPNLTVLTAGRCNGFDLLARTEIVEALLRDLAANFDHVVIDTPPCLAVVDGLVLAKLADQVVHVVRWAQTSREMIKATANLFDNIDTDRIGVVLTQVDAKRHAIDGYSDSVYYHRSLNQYYLG